MTSRPDLRIVTTDRGQGPRPLRVCLDANVWISYLAAASAMRRSLPSTLVEAIDRGEAGGLPLQLFLSFELLDTINGVLLRLGIGPALASGFVAGIEGLMRAGPERLDPPLFLCGRDQLPMHDREDAGVLGACFASDVELLVTDNLVDFATREARRHATQVVTRRDGSRRQLFALIHEPVAHAPLVVMHPKDAVEWLGRGERPTPGRVREAYPSAG